MKQHISATFLVFCIVLLGVNIASAQEGDLDVIVDGFNSPRSVFYDADGTLYVVDAGLGGRIETATPIAEALGGGSSNVYRVDDDGSVDVVFYGFNSVNVQGTEAVGTSDLVVTDDSWWVLLGQGSAVQPNNPTNPFSYALVQLNGENQRLETFVDLLVYELENNPDGLAIDSNPNDMVLADDGTIYIADAGANTVFSWSEADGLQAFHTWDDNPVPNSVAIGPDGDLYVGFLSSFNVELNGFPEGAARIEHWTRDGELVETFEGLTLCTDIAIADDGTIYAVELGRFDLSTGGLPWLPETGRVVKVTEDGLEVLADGLNYAHGIAVDPEGGLTVTVNAAFVEGGTGAVIHIDG